VLWRVWPFKTYEAGMKIIVMTATDRGKSTRTDPPNEITCTKVVNASTTMEKTIKSPTGPVMRVTGILGQFGAPTKYYTS
jgi:hypothetical protein